MHHRPFGPTPAQSEITAALARYLRGRSTRNPRRILAGLAVLRQATREQLALATALLELSRNLTRGGIGALLVRPGARR